VVPPEDELIGVLDTLMPIADVRNETTVPPDVRVALMKCVPWFTPVTVSGRRSRHSGWPHVPKVNSWVIAARGD
jgi:hypothetical protein